MTQSKPIASGRRKPVAVYYRMLQYQPENMVVLRAAFDVIETETPADDDESLLRRAELCFAPLGFRFDAAKMDQCVALRAIATNTTGVPHIDVEAAEVRGIRVFSLKDEQAFLDTITPTAEHTWGLLLALIRRTGPAQQSVLAGGWNRRPFGAPAMLSRLSLGIIGYGRLGRRVARYGRAFDMPVRFYDPAPRTGEPGIEPVASIEELVAWADVVSLHAPALPTTRGLISAEAFRRFKPGAYFINTARAEIVDEIALLEALESGRLAGAALDVLDGEFAPDFDAGSHPLVAYARNHENLLITPHIGGSTRDAWRETERHVIDMAIAHFARQDRS